MQQNKPFLACIDNSTLIRRILCNSDQSSLIIDDMQQNKAFLACIGNSTLIRRTLRITDVNLQVYTICSKVKLFLHV